MDISSCQMKKIYRIGALAFPLSAVRAKTPIGLPNNKTEIFVFLPYRRPYQ
jgi:hypothetical protein